MRTYTCEGCGEFCESHWTRKEAMNEAEDTFGKRALDVPQIRVCDDCYKKFIDYWEALPPKERARLEREAGL